MQINRLNFILFLPFILYHISYFYFLILGVCCGNCNTGYINDRHLESTVSLSCDLCPKSDANISNHWCSGDCFYDHTHQICREGK